jgi:hypothetical protein
MLDFLVQTRHTRSKIVICPVPPMEDGKKTNKQLSFWPKADIPSCSAHVRYWPIADISVCTAHVRFHETG